MPNFFDYLFRKLPGQLLELLFRKLFRKLLDLFSRSAATVNSTVPFLTRTVLPHDYPTDDDTDIDRFDGLLALQISRGNTAAQALALWQSRDHFEKSNSQFESLLKSSVIDGELLVQFLLPKKTWYDRLTIPVIYTFIVTTVAVLATVEALRNDYSWLFGTPKIGLFDPGKEHDFLVYQPIVLDYPITNTGRSNARIEFIKQSVRPIDTLSSADGLELPAHAPELKTLEPNKTDSFPIRGRGIKPGTYEIRYSGRLSNEWLRKESWEGLTYKVRVWPECRVLLDPQNNFSPDPGVQCYVRGTIEVGRSAERGLKCRAALVGVSGVHVEGAQLLNTTMTSKRILASAAGDNSKAITAFAWTTGRVERFTPVYFSLTLTSESKLTKDRWSEIVKRIHTEAEIQ